MSRSTIAILGCYFLIVVTLVHTATAEGRYSGIKTADQQCIDMGYSGGLCGDVSSDVCGGLICADAHQRSAIINRPMDGTGCGNSKVCINGVCQGVDPSDTNTQRLPQREGCRARWGPQG